MTIRSPFAEQEREAGAAFVARFGIEVPEHYGDPDREYRAARASVGLVDMSFRGLLRIAGSERLRWLNGQITNDVKALRAGTGLLAAALTAKGHLLSDLVVCGLEDSVWIDLPRDRAPMVRDAFERHIIADDVQVEDVSDRFAHLAVIGPGAARFLAEAGAEACGALTPWSHADGRIGGVPLRIVASRRLAFPSFDLLIPVEAAAQTWRALTASGRDTRACPVGMAALDWLRVEAGWPWLGVDFGEENLLMEALTPEYVSLTKGCYVGQEVVIRIEHQGHLNKRLCGLVVDGSAPPPPGSPIRAGDREVGHVTSAVRSPALGRMIALGYLRREQWTPGTRLRIATPERSVEATVTALPFAAGR